MEYICSYCKKNFGNHKTEYREHRKICECKPNEYVCEFCGKKFSRAGVYTAHRDYQCILNPDKKEQRHVCGFKIHSKRKPGGWKCEICGSVFETRSLLSEHKHSLGHICKGGHNQYTKAKEFGLPKPELSNEARKKMGNANRGKHLSEEQKQKISKTMKNKIADGSFIVPYKRNHSSKVSYPEKYFMEVLKDLPVKYNYQVGLYQLDFAIPEKMVYVEIDGEQHYVDKRIVEHDKERTEKLNSLGWKCLKRVRWSEFQKLSQDDKKVFCEDLINHFSVV